MVNPMRVLIHTGRPRFHKTYRSPVPIEVELPRKPPTHYAQPYHYAQMQFLTFLFFAILTGNMLLTWLINLLWWVGKSSDKPRHSDKFLKATYWTGGFIFTLIALAKL